MSLLHCCKFRKQMALNRIRSKVNKHLSPNQNGFRPGQSTTTHIFAARQLIEGVKSHNLKAVVVFIDFKKGGDSNKTAEIFKNSMTFFRGAGSAEPVPNTNQSIGATIAEPSSTSSNLGEEAVK